METSLATCEGHFLIQQNSVHREEKAGGGGNWGGQKAGEGRVCSVGKWADPSEARAVVGTQLPGARGEGSQHRRGVSWGPSGSRVLGSSLCPSRPPPASLACLPLLPPFPRLLEQQAEQLQCETSPNPTPATLPVAVRFGATERRLQHSQFEYTLDPNITSAGPTKSFLRCQAKGVAAWPAAGGSLQGFLADGAREGPRGFGLGMSCLRWDWAVR